MLWMESKLGGRDQEVFNWILNLNSKEIFCVYRAMPNLLQILQNIFMLFLVSFKKELYVASIAIWS